MNLVVSEKQRLKVVLNIIVLGMSLFNIFQREVLFDETSLFERTVIDSIAPIQRGVFSLRESVSSLFSDYLLNVSASKMNKDLRKQMADLNHQVFTYEEVRRENLRLKKMLQFAQTLPRHKVLAQVVAWDASSDFKVIRLNRGLEHGVKLQDPVITSDGLVGYVYRLTDNFSDVLTILDPNNRIDAIIERTRSHGIIEGRARGKCQMKYVSRTEPVILHDKVFSSGLGHIYPKGVVIGKVTKIQKESYGITQYIEIGPSDNFAQLEEVLILTTSGEYSYQKELKALDELKN